jgi:DNA-binding transcriptional MerR regulator
MTTYPLEQVLEITGLKGDFSRKCLKHLREYLKPHERRGEFNRLLYNQSGLVVWDKIKQMKEQGLSLPEMKRQLETSKTPAQTDQPKHDKTAPLTDPTEKYLQKIIEIQSQHYQEIKAERDRSEKVIREQSQEIKDWVIKYQALDSAIKMLPEGKTPEQIRVEWEADQKKRIEIAAIISELKITSFIRFRRKAALYKRLEKLTGLKTPFTKGTQEEDNARWI